jgi:hypothetical protein
MTQVTASISTGPGATQPNGTRAPTFATPGALTASIAGTILTVSAVSQGLLQPGQALAGAGLTPQTAIASQLTGASGGVGTYGLNRDYTGNPISSEVMTTAMLLMAQIQPLTWRDLQQLDGLNLSGLRKKIYVGGDLNGIVRVSLKGGDLITTPDGNVWLVAQQLEGWSATAGWTAAAIVLQNGS